MLRKIIKRIASVSILSLIAVQSIFAEVQVIRLESHTVITDGQSSNSETYYTENLGKAAGSIKIKEGDSKVVAGNSVYDFGYKAYIQNESNSFMIPLRATSTASEVIDNSAVGVEWNNDKKQGIINYNGKEICFTAGSSVYTIDGVSKNCDNNAVAEIHDGTMFVPLRTLGVALGFKVLWNSAERMALLEN